MSLTYTNIFNMKKLLTLSLAVALSANLFAFSSATEISNASTAAFESNLMPQRWEKLGTRKVNLRVDHDEILVTARDGLFTKLKFVVRKAPIFVHNVRIVFGNGEDKNIVVNKRIAPGTESRVIDLPGNKRIIRKVVLNYKSVPTGLGRATVVLWGRH